MEDVSGINREEMLTLSKSFLRYHDDIKDIFLEYKKTIDATVRYYQGDVADAYRSKFKNFDANLAVVLKSFLDYSETLMEVVKKYDDFYFDSSRIVY